jgi:hypothetical protein
MRVLTKVMLLTLTAIVGTCFGQGPLSQPVKADEPAVKGAEPAKPDEPSKQSLEELMAAALRNNPDIQAAESKVREAEAELRRTRMIVASTVAAEKAKGDAARRLFEAAQEEHQMYLQLHKRGAGSESDVRRSQAGMLKAKSDVAVAEAALNTLTGTLPGATGRMLRAPGGQTGAGTPAPGAGAGVPGPGGPNVPNVGFGAPGGIGMFPGAAGGALGVAGGAGGMAFAAESPIRVPRGPMVEKIRAALDKPVVVMELKEVPLGNSVAFFRDAAGVPFLAHLGDKAKEPVSLALKGEIALGAALQALQDVVPGLQCYVREYGILVTLDDAAPPDGMPLIDFWHKKGEAGGSKK